MILLLTRDNASYEASTKTFYFNLDKQLKEGVKHIRFQSFSFRPSTATSYPHGILACSRALSNLSLREHVTVLKDANHRDDTDVLCCLHKENHNTEHLLYTLAHPVTMSLDRRSFIKKIDLYFTDMAGTRLDGDYVVEAPASPNAADIQALYSGVFVRLFFDAQQAGAFERGDGETTRVGEDVATWTSRFRETEWLGDMVSSEVELGNFIQPHVVSIQENAVGTHNDFMRQSNVGFTIPDTGSLFALFETPSSLPSTERMHSAKRQFILFLNSTGALGVKSSVAPGTVTDMITGIETSQPYLVELRYTVIAGSPHNTANYIMHLTKLLTTGHSEFTASVTGIDAHSTTGNGTTFEIGTNSVDHLKMKYSSCILLEGTNATHRAQCKEFLIKKWEGVETETVAVPGAVSSKWLAEIRY